MAHFYKAHMKALNLDPPDVIRLQINLQQWTPCAVLLVTHLAYYALDQAHKILKEVIEDSEIQCELWF